MGLNATRAGGIVRKDDVSVAKSCLSQDELKVLNRIVNVYLEYAELHALDRRPMSMQDWISKLDEFVKVSARELLDHAGNVSADAAHVMENWSTFATARCLIHGLRGSTPTSSE